MGSDTIEMVIYLSVLMLIPLAPACILYKFLPSKTLVEGPFKGLTINLSGAFAGYFILVLVALSLLYPKIISTPQNYEVWKIKGRVFYEYTTNNGGKKLDATGIKLGILPPEFQIGTHGNFWMNVLVRPGHVSGSKDYPTLFFRHKDHKEESIVLNSANCDINHKAKEIILTQDIRLEKLPEPIRGLSVESIR